MNQPTMEGSHSTDAEAPPSSTATDQPNKGGWLTFPFIMVATWGTILANQGWVSNLIVYLISEYKVKNIDAAQISNLVNGFTFFIPVVAAIVADSFLGCFTVIWISSLLSLLGTVILFITTFLSSTSYQSCENGSPNLCDNTPSNLKTALLYTGIVLGTIGAGGTRSTLSNMGADQLNKPKDQSLFFNWFFVAFYTAQVIATTVIVYVEDNVSWSWGFGICVGANLIGSTIFLIGIRYYRYVKPEGSPFTGIARVIVAAIMKRNVFISTESKDFYYANDHEVSKSVVSTPTKNFKCLNRAALITEGDINIDGSVAKPWKLCTVQQVEDFKSVIKILPLWSSSIWLGTPIGVLAALSVLQALTMDRHIGSKFQIPPASILVFILISTAICLIFFDCFILPTFNYFLGRPLTPLQRIGIGQVLNVTGMAISAIVESKRLNVAKSRHIDKNALQGFIVPMSVLWLVPQLAFVGIAEAFHYPGQVGLYYQEFPKTLKNLATAMISLLVAVAFYLSTVVIDIFRRVTTWLPNDLNKGRLDLVYWVIVGLGVLNFGYYLVCSRSYTYQNVEIVPKENSSQGSS